MTTDGKREDLFQKVKEAKDALYAAEAALRQFDASPERHVYESLDAAKARVGWFLEEQAHEACEGSYNCGLDYYTQEFIVDGVHYIGFLEVEYDRHAKTYYYVDRTTFSYKKKDTAE